jgi:hypothetical protein
VTKSFYSDRCSRIEERVNFKEDILLEQGIKEAVDRTLEILSAFEMLKHKSEM